MIKQCDCSSCLRMRCYLSMLLAITVGCGHYPPPVNSAADVRKVPISEKSIRTRGLSDGDIPSLARLRGLTYISFSAGMAVERAEITDAGLKTLAHVDLPHLDTLDLGWCDNITDAGVAHVCKMKSLRTLLLWACPGITDDVAEELVNTDLTYLDLRGCPGITDRGLEALAAKTDWQHFELGGEPNITAQGIAKLQAALPNAEINKDDREWQEHWATIKAK